MLLYVPLSVFPIIFINYNSFYFDNNQQVTRSVACVAWRFCRAGRTSGQAARKIKIACPDSWPFQLPPTSTHFDILLTTCLVSVFSANQK